MFENWLKPGHDAKSNKVRERKVIVKLIFDLHTDE